MKTRLVLCVSFLIFAFDFVVSHAAENRSWTGEFADKKFMGGQAVFQLSLTQEANETVKIGFDAVYNNGRDCAPEAEGTGKITSKGTLKFTFQDNHHNAGTGTITRAGDDVILSLKATRVADPKCVVFYRDNIRLKRMP
jgi:hypothetical protein